MVSLFEVEVLLNSFAVEMNVLFSSDDNYAQHLGVAMYSLLKNNQKAESIHIFVVNYSISEVNLAKLREIVAEFKNAELSFLDFEEYANQLKLKMPWPISLSAYARIFVASLLPTDILRVLYLDCDMVINEDLEELWKTNLYENCLGAIQDQVFPRIKKSIGIDIDLPYFNSGLLLIDLKKWRAMKIEDKCLNFIAHRKGQIIHHDQGVLNGVLPRLWTRIPLKYNVMTLHYFFSQRQVRKYFKDTAPYYEDSEVSYAKRNPAILHFTPSFTCHPWQKGCHHPLKKYYLDALFLTPWAKMPLRDDHSIWYLKLLNWRFRVLPF